MSPPRRSGDVQVRHRRLEMLIFLGVSGIGVYAFGSGMRALSQPGGEAGLAWLAIAGAAISILFSQMSRVHDSWPRRGKGEWSGGPVGPKGNSELRGSSPDHGRKKDS